MKFLVLAALLFVHGAIHSMGFLKAYGLADLPQLRQPISHAFGLVWLSAGVLFVLAAGLLVAGVREWWIAACPALVLSQVAISASFSDAKWGSVVNAIAGVAVAVTLVGLRAAR